MTTTSSTPALVLASLSVWGGPALAGLASEAGWVEPSLAGVAGYFGVLAVAVAVAVRRPYAAAPPRAPKRPKA